MTLLRASAPEGPWTSLAAAFIKKSTNLYEAEVTAGSASGPSFYRLMMTGNDGTLRIESPVKSGNKLRIPFGWAH